MDETKRNTIRGWIEKAADSLDSAREHLKWSTRISDAVQSAQQCIELSIKATLMLLRIQYALSHGWTQKEIAGIAKQIKDRDLPSKLKEHSLDFSIRLPRLLFRANFWSHFYSEAKYGFEAEHLASAQELFEKADAELAVNHADDSLWCARTLLNFPSEKLDELTR